MAGKEKERRGRRYINIDKMKVRTVTGILLIALAAAGIYYWETVGEKSYSYSPVLVAGCDIAAGDEITEEMLSLVRYPSEAVVSGAVSSPADLVGKEATCYIAQGMQLIPQFFDAGSYAPEDGQFVLSVPESWLVNVPQSIRRGDTVCFYPVEEVSPYEERQASASSRCLLSATVCYAKDSSNREVVDSSGSARMDGTANVAVLEVIVTEKEYQQLYASRASGHSFIVMYQ